MTILTESKLKEMTAISNAVDYKNLEPFVEIAEEFYLKPVLGSEYYDSILDDIENNELIDDDLKLVNEYVLPVIAYYSWYESAPFIYMKTENKGLVKKFSDNSNSIDSQDFKMYRQSILDKAVMYSNRLKRHLYDNKAFYPKHKVSSDSMGKSNSAGFFLNY